MNHERSGNDHAKLASVISERAGVTPMVVAHAIVPVPKAAKVMGRC